MSQPALTDIPGIGPSTAAALSEHGFATVDHMAGATPAALAKVPGFGLVRATMVIEAAGEAIATPAEELVAEKPAKAVKKRPKKKGSEKKGSEKKKAGKKDKKGKKGKKKDSDKKKDGKKGQKSGKKVKKSKTGKKK